jgi:hypothetical protein
MPLLAVLATILSQKQKKPRCVIVAKISMLVRYYIWRSPLPELLDLCGSEDKPPSRISISNDSYLKGSGAIEDAAKVRISFFQCANFFYILF